MKAVADSDGDKVGVWSLLLGWSDRHWPTDSLCHYTAAWKTCSFPLTSISGRCSSGRRHSAVVLMWCEDGVESGSSSTKRLGHRITVGHTGETLVHWLYSSPGMISTHRPACTEWHQSEGIEASWSDIRCITGWRYHTSCATGYLVTLKLNVNSEGGLFNSDSWRLRNVVIYGLSCVVRLSIDALRVL